LISFAARAGRLFALRPEANSDYERFDTRYRLHEKTLAGWRLAGEASYARGARLAGPAANGVWVWDRASRRAFVAPTGEGAGPAIMK
jgi:hypothetical protein